VLRNCSSGQALFLRISCPEPQPVSCCPTSWLAQAQKHVPGNSAFGCLIGACRSLTALRPRKSSVTSYRRHSTPRVVVLATAKVLLTGHATGASETRVIAVCASVITCSNELQVRAVTELDLPEGRRSQRC